jgi:hypothetical protein
MLRWHFTVFSAIRTFAAISLLHFPSAKSERTSRSVELNSPSGLRDARASATGSGRITVSQDRKRLEDEFGVSL